MAPLSISGKSVRAVPQRLAERFGSDFYSHQHYSGCLDSQNEEEWKLRLEGQLFETGDKLQVTAFDELKKYISQQLSLGSQKAEVSQNA